jgi:hypothetical protein
MHHIRNSLLTKKIIENTEKHRYYTAMAVVGIMNCRMALEGLSQTLAFAGLGFLGFDGA